MRLTKEETLKKMTCIVNASNDMSKTVFDLSSEDLSLIGIVLSNRHGQTMFNGPMKDMATAGIFIEMGMRLAIDGGIIVSDESEAQIKKLVDCCFSSCQPAGKATVL